MNVEDLRPFIGKTDGGRIVLKSGFLETMDKLLAYTLQDRSVAIKGILKAYASVGGSDITPQALQDHLEKTKPYLASRLYGTPVPENPKYLTDIFCQLRSYDPEKFISGSTYKDAGWSSLQKDIGDLVRSL